MSNNYSEFDKNSRFITSKVDIYFDGINNSPTTFNTDMIVDWDINEGLSNINNHPIGSMISNELNLNILNQDGLLDPNNENSIYHKKIKRKLPIKVYIKEDETPDWILVGTYYVDDWIISSSNMSVNIIAYDLLYDILNKPIPVIPMEVNNKLSNMLYDIFKKLGCSDDKIIIDVDLNDIVLDYSFGLEGITSSTLNELCNTYLFYITVDRLENIRCTSLNSILKLKPIELSGNKQVYTLNAGTSILKEYNGVKVTYKTYKTSDSDVVVDIKDKEYNVGETILRDIKFNKTLINRINGITTVSEHNSNAVILNFDPYNINIQVNNSHTSKQNITLMVQASSLEVEYESDVRLLNENNDNDTGTIFEVNGSYITSNEIASNICKVLLNYLTSNNTNFDIELKGNPIIKPGAVISVKDIPKTGEQTGIVYNVTMKYDGSFSMMVKCINKGVISQ